MAYLIIAEVVINPKLNIRIKVKEHTFANVRHKVGDLLLREVVRLVHEQIVTSHTLCGLAILVGIKEQHAAVVLASYLFRRHQHVKVLLQRWLAADDCLAVGISAETTLFVGHRSHVHHVAELVRIEQQLLADEERLAASSAAAQGEHIAPLRLTPLNVLVQFRVSLHFL